MTDSAATAARPRSVCVIVPCYNEAQRLDVRQFQQFLSAQPKVLLLFVDDGSTDGTMEALSELRAGFESSACILRSDRNRGKAEAVRCGMLHALDNFDPAVLGFWDADLATPLASIPRFLQVLREESTIQMIFGARVHLLGRHVKRSALRHYLGRVFATAVSRVLRMPIYDTQCGAKLFRAGPETRGIFAEPFLSKWVFDVEILARYQQLFRREGRQLADAIYEYPLETWIDVAGSKVTLADFLTAFWDVARIRRKYLL